MTQNIYDNDEFFAGYGRLPRSVEGLDGAPEWPVLQAMLPDLRGRRVLDLGCGFGWFCRWARERGAVHIEGIDVSEKMLARARTATGDATIIYVRADLERLALRASSFDVVYSSLALHYIVDLERLLAEVHQTLVIGGSLVFSVEHPIMTAPAPPGWSTDGAGRRVWPVTGYLDEGPRSTDWLTKGVIKQHRTLATYVNLLLRLGFALTHVEEWGPSTQQILERPQLAHEHERPPFLLVAARR
ncbi:MAG TPA: class I SAM-dependent methyltransferase [Hyphomicrobiaceae bacterium]|nr:class I SAM-dependent methyltransferase [Hyphomicrobiaceae bacterium]